MFSLILASFKMIGRCVSLVLLVGLYYYLWGTSQVSNTFKWLVINDVIADWSPIAMEVNDNNEWCNL